MLQKLLLMCLVALPVVVFADANDGQFMGFQLGEDYPRTPPGSESTTTGNLLIVAEEPVKPADIEQVTLVVTPVSRTIGFIHAASWHATEDEARIVGRRYVELLQAKYPDWSFGREAMDASFRIVEVNFDNSPYNIQLRVVRDEHNGSDMWRFSVGLGWQEGSTPWQAWQEASATQKAARTSSKNEQLLEGADVRGL
jgi:hypothetical protein